MQTNSSLARPTWPAILQTLPPIPQARSVDLDPLIDRIVAGEQELLATMRRCRPILETYLQETASKHPGKQPAGTDHYMLGRLSPEDGVGFEPFLLSERFRRGGARLASPIRRRRWLFGDGRRRVLLPQGFVRMVSPDFDDFSRNAYRFEFIRREFLGAVRCLVLDLTPRDARAVGRFIGRLWVEDRDGCIVRFNGTIRSAKPAALFLHFDSWRFNIAPRLWLPAVVYIEDTKQEGGEAGRFQGQTHLWGYRGAESPGLASAERLGSADVSLRDDKDGACDIGPLESQHAWKRLAERNIIDRLEKSGLLARQGEVDEILDTVIHNLVVSNEIQLDVHCRVLLTTPLETLSIGQAIVVSRGLLDVLPDEASLAMVLSDELAHIVLGHPTDTMFAFADRNMFPDREIPRRFRFQRTAAEMEAAHQKALEILTHSPYSDKMATAGLFLKTLRRRAPQLPNLIRATLGNQLATGEDLVRLGELAKKTPELNTAPGEQVAALALGSRIRLDPWTNQVRMLRGKPLAPKSGKDETHFAVLPLLMHLSRAQPSPASLAETEPEAKARTAGEI